ncbi:hypothetical protein KFL_008070020 [Klebsormidium nitens]|uniref:SUN domain-containing protein n=1 Tax=Klebsormidium nitens TaxID=105231 RepID=A0A1Y1IPY7_KLENI|nr:hypothetical protein KFL_008070020 [Klebsormidium nitens]|eukprot:GAQ91559.1 hypothetical protein KFL_008070020 [Klebsormidium nitens]
MKEDLRRCQRSSSQQGCQHTSCEAAGCLLVPGAALLLVVLQLALLLDLAATGSAAAAALIDAPPVPDVVCDAEGAACVHLEPDAPPVITERDLGIGLFSPVKGSAVNSPDKKQETVTGIQSGEREARSEQGGGDEVLVSGDSNDERSSGSQGETGGERAPQDAVDGDASPSDPDVDADRAQVQLVEAEKSEEANDAFCAGRKDSGRGQCQWEGDALRFPGWEGDGWALLCTLVPESELRRMAELTPGDDSAEDAPRTLSDPPPGQELQVLDTAPSTRPPRVAPIGLDEYRKAALQQQEQAPNASEAAPGGAPPAQKRVHPEGPRFNYASVTAGAKVVAANKEAKGQGNVLDEDKDKYLRNPCSVDDQWVVIELTQDTRIDTVVLSNYEFYASGPKNFSLSGSQTYPNDGAWTPLGEFTAQNVRTPQSFELSENAQSAWVRYLLVKLLSHYGAEFYCTLSLVRVHGTDALESFREELVEAMREAGTDAPVGIEGGAETGQGAANQGSGLAEEMAALVGGETERNKAEGGLSGEDEVDELLRSPAELDAAQTKEGLARHGEASVREEGESGAKSWGVRVAEKAAAVVDAGATKDGCEVLEEIASRRSSTDRGNSTIESSPQASTAASDKVNTTTSPPTARETKEANANRTEDTQTPSNATDDTARLGNGDATSSTTPGTANQTAAAAASLTSASGAPTSTSGPATGTGWRGGAGSTNGRQGGDFVLRVLLQRLKGLEVNASLFEGYVAETHQQFSHSLNDLDADIEALASRLNATTAMAAKMWARLHAVDEARIRALESRDDLLVTQVAELTTTIAQLRQSLSELVFAFLCLSCLTVMLLVAQCCRRRTKQD